MATRNIKVWNAATSEWDDVAIQQPVSSGLATLSSPNFTGTPTAPTAAADTNTTQVATTAYVVGQGYAKLASPALTGTPTAPTASAGTNTTQVATTQFVQGEIDPRAPLFASFFSTGTGSVSVSVPAGNYLVDAGHSDTRVSVGASAITGSGMLTVASTGTSVAVSRPEIPGSGVEPTTWTTRGNAGSTNSSTWRGFAYGNGVYVGVGFVSTEYRTSTDLVTWTTRTIAWPGMPGPNAIAFGAGVFVMGGHTHNIFTSTDGITWTQRTSYANAGSRINRIIFSRGQFVSTGEGGHTGTSPDGITWTTRTIGTTETQNGLADGAGQYVVFGGHPRTSTDGVTWTSRTTPSSSMLDLAYGSSGGFIAAGGGSGLLIVSTDGITWTTRQSTTSGNSTHAISFGAGVYCIGQSMSGMITSTNGVTWTTRTTGLSVGYAVSFANGFHIGGNSLNSATSISYAAGVQLAGTPQPTYARMQRLASA